MPMPKGRNSEFVSKFFSHRLFRQFSVEYGAEGDAIDYDCQCRFFVAVDVVVVAVLILDASL